MRERKRKPFRSLLFLLPLQRRPTKNTYLLPRQSRPLLPLTYDDSIRFVLRVRPRSLREITQFPHHQADRCQVHERQRIAEAIFKVLGQPTTPIEPRNRALDNPAFR